MMMMMIPLNEVSLKWLNKCKEICFIPIFIISSVNTLCYFSETSEKI
jgi:hypothetical protein